MVGLAAALSFVGMVLAPCAVAVYSKLGSSSEGYEALPGDTAQDVGAPAPAGKLTAEPPNATQRLVSLSTSRETPVAAPVAVPSLREIAERAARDAMQAQAVAAKALVEALQEESRAAAKRAAAAEKLAEAAESELVRASHAVLQAEAAKARARLATEEASSERDYLPQNHPSLDFPRSRVSPRKVA